MMGSTHGSTKKKPYLKLLVAGVVSVALYVLLLTQQGVVNDYFSRGGLYAFLPIIAAFVFSFVHGSFTGNFWTVLGVEAAKKHREVK
ncbi:MAG: hypothetical protein HQL08_05050 [Nitrospirae bacterium]|nr:hypothetical protein [Nitrospirota bacterium]